MYYPFLSIYHSTSFLGMTNRVFAKNQKDREYFFLLHKFVGAGSKVKLHILSTNGRTALKPCFWYFPIELLNLTTNEIKIYFFINILSNKNTLPSYDTFFLTNRATITKVLSLQLLQKINSVSLLFFQITLKTHDKQLVSVCLGMENFKICTIFSCCTFCRLICKNFYL